jgi:hypothetical protein
MEVTVIVPPSMNCKAAVVELLKSESTLNEKSSLRFHFSEPEQLVEDAMKESSQ